MKKINRKITAIAAAAATVLSMTAAMSFTATAEEKSSKYDELVENAKGFNIDSDTFENKYSTAKQLLNADNDKYDFIDDEKNKGLGFEDYDELRKNINSLYASSVENEFAGYTADEIKKIKPFSKKSFAYTQGYTSNGKCYDVDGDNTLSFYDYCCLLRYLQEKIGITDEYTDFTVEDMKAKPKKYSYSNDVLDLNDGEAYITLKKVVSDKEKITVPTEICCKIGHKDGNGKLKTDDNGNVIYSWHIIPVMNIAAKTFSGCTNAKEVTIKNYVQPEWFNMLQSLDEEFEIIETKNTVTATTFVDIADNAFEGCTNLKKINFPKHVNFGIDAFNGTDFAKPENKNIYPEKGVIYAKSSDGEALVACGTYDPNLAFGYKNDMYYFDLSENTTTITNKLKNALNSIYNQVEYSVTIPEKVEYIHDKAFSDCKNLKYVNFEEYKNFANDDPVKELIRKSNAVFNSTQFIADAAKNEIDTVVKNLNSKTYKNEMEKVEAVCRYIFDNATYRDYHALAEQFDLFPNGTFNTLDESRGNVYVTANAFLSNYTECESYGKAVSLLLDKMGVENFLTGTRGTFGGYGHAYNHVYIDGKWYLVDMSGYGHFKCDYEKYKNARGGNFVQNSVGANIAISCDSEFMVFGDDKQLTDRAYDIYNFSRDRSKVYFIASNNAVIPDKLKNKAYEIINDCFIMVEENGKKKIKYVDENGDYVRKPYIEVNGKKYNFDPKGNLIDKGWVEMKYVGRAYINQSGEVVSNCWDIIKNKNGKDSWFFFDDNGICHEGWIEYGKEYYYCDIDEGTLENKFIKVDGSYYYLNADGKRITYSEGKNYADYSVQWRGRTLTADSEGKLNVSNVLWGYDLEEFNNSVKNYD